MNSDKKVFGCKSTTISYFFKKMWEYRKGFYFFYSIYVAVMILQPLVNIFCPRYIIDEISDSKNLDLIVDKIIFIVAFMILCTSIVNVAIVFLDNQLSKVYYEDLNRLLEANVGRKSMELQYVATESRKTLDYINNAKLGITNGYSGGMSGLFKAFALFVSNIGILLITAGVVIKYSWWLLLVVIVNVIVNTAMSNQINKIQLAQFEKLSFINRGYSFLLHTLSDIKYGKDIRLFGARKMMIRRVDDFNLDQTDIAKKQAMESQKYIYISKLDMAVTTILTYLILAVMAVKGKVTIGEFTMLATSSSAIVVAMNAILQQVFDLKKFSQYAKKYIEYQENNVYEEKGRIQCDSVSNVEIEFKNVFFKYPEQEQYALKNVNVKIGNGEHWSIVGLNGAGKTTFIKLLCRLYECTEGEITLNGINILEYDDKSYRKLLAAVFQDFQLLNFTIKENIITGEYDSVPDDEVNAIIKEVGLEQKVSSLPLGIATPVFRYYDTNGFEPSGGEQQKLAMARALYKNAPILILDEPTAALDPIAEKEIYEKFNEMTVGKTTLFISHRLASCKFCNNILVFKDGQIVERGTHKDLVELENGLYAQMFNAQAQYYV